MNDTSNAPNIYLLVVTLLHWIDDFGRHPKYRARHSCGCPETVNIVCPLRNTEIRYFTDSCRFNQNIVRFQILHTPKLIRLSKERRDTHSMKNTLGM